MEKLNKISLLGVATALFACNSGGSTGIKDKYTVTGPGGANPITQGAAVGCSFKDHLVSCTVGANGTSSSDLVVAAQSNPGSYIVNPTGLPSGLTITYSGGQTAATNIAGNIAIQCKQADMGGKTSAEYTIQLDGSQGKMDYLVVKCNVSG